jgi:ATP/maltotriose-dependent transcriptional regulator MalT
MSGNGNAISVLRTKLNRPALVTDHLPRQHLSDRLNRNRHRPLTLVSAPAGYGMIIPGRDNDQWGIGWSGTHISSDLRDDLDLLGIDLDSF